jgi:hypothetical protein
LDATSTAPVNRGSILSCVLDARAVKLGNILLPRAQIDIAQTALEGATSLLQGSKTA